MFLNKEKSKRKNAERASRKKAYDRVYALHENAEFLCYINDAYHEKYNGSVSIKLEGTVAKGIGHFKDTFLLFDCNGRRKAVITMEELYCGSNRVEQLEGGDKLVALYPNEQEVDYLAGDILCILPNETNLV